MLERTRVGIEEESKGTQAELVGSGIALGALGARQAVIWGSNASGEPF